MRLSGFDARLKLASASIVAIKSSQDVKTQLMLFCIICTNYNHKPLAGVRKPVIFTNEFKGLALKKGPKVA